MASSACKNSLQPATLLCSCSFFIFIGIPVFIIQPILEPEKTGWNFFGIIFFLSVAVPMSLFIILKYTFACLPISKRIRMKNQDLLPQTNVACVSTVSEDYSIIMQSCESSPSILNLESKPPKYDPPPSYHDCTFQVDKQTGNQDLPKLKSYPKEEVI